MKNRMTERNLFWFVVGAIFGSVVIYYLPTEPAFAATANSGDKFSMCTVRTSVGASEAIFVLDQVTGRLLGAQHSLQRNAFHQLYQRTLAADFGVTDNARYVMVSGDIQTGGGGGAAPPAQGAIYVAELNAGVVFMYGFTMSPAGQAGPPRELIPLASFPFRGN